MQHYSRKTRHVESQVCFFQNHLPGILMISRGIFAWNKGSQSNDGFYSRNVAVLTFWSILNITGILPLKAQNSLFEETYAGNLTNNEPLGFEKTTAISVRKGTVQHVFLTCETSTFSAQNMPLSSFSLWWERNNALILLHAKSTWIKNTLRGPSCDFVSFRIPFQKYLFKGWNTLHLVKENLKIDPAVEDHKKHSENMVTISFEAPEETLGLRTKTGDIVTH